MLPCQWEEIAIEHLAGAPAKRIGPPEEFSPFTAPDFEDVFGSGKLLNLNDETASQPDACSSLDQISPPRAGFSVPATHRRHAYRLSKACNLTA